MTDSDRVDLLIRGGIVLPMDERTAFEGDVDFQAPPFQVEPYSPEAARWAAAYGTRGGCGLVSVFSRSPINA